MTQLTINISNPQGKNKTGLDEALEDVANGNITRYDSVDDFFKDMHTAAV